MIIQYYTNRVRYSCPSSNGYVKEQSDERDHRGSSAEEKVNTDVPAEAKTHTATDVWNLSPKRMGVYRNRQRVLNTAHFSFLSFLEFQTK